jgi:transcriptional regulator with XRE-family HTH domain
MKIDARMTDDALLKLIGERLARLRLSKNLTQEQLAEQAGLGLRTLQRLELGTSATQLSGFIRICRALDLIERFEVLIPEATASPVARLKLHSRQRQRASRRKSEAAKPMKWTWGENS